MASTTTLTANTTTPYATLLNVAEAGTAAAAESVDIVTLLTAAGLTSKDPLFAGLSQAFADQTAARNYLFQNLDLMDYFTASSVGTSATIFDANVSAPNVAGNFRLVITAVKAANADTYTLKSRLALRHSIVR